MEVDRAVLAGAPAGSPFRGRLKLWPVTPRVGMLTVRPCAVGDAETVGHPIGRRCRPRSPRRRGGRRATGRARRAPPPARPARRASRARPNSRGRSSLPSKMAARLPVGRSRGGQHEVGAPRRKRPDGFAGGRPREDRPGRGGPAAARPPPGRRRRRRNRRGTTSSACSGAPVAMRIGVSPPPATTSSTSPASDSPSAQPAPANGSPWLAMTCSPGPGFVG